MPPPSDLRAGRSRQWLDAIKAAAVADRASSPPVLSGVVYSSALLVSSASSTDGIDPRSPSTAGTLVPDTMGRW